MINNMKSKRNREGGNALVEFALMATVLLLFTAGVSDFGRLPSLATMASGAAEAGVQYGALSPAHFTDLPGIQNAALSSIGNYAGATATASQFCACSVGGAHISCPATCATGSPETYVQVVVTVPFSMVFNLPWIPNPVTISQLACARVQ